MNSTTDVTHREGRMIGGTNRVQIRALRHHPIVPGGITFHVMEQVLPDNTVRPLVRIDAVLYESGSKPILSWQLTAPAFEYDLPHLWLAVRAFETEGDTLDALWRLRGMAEEGLLPTDLRDAI